MRPGLVMILLLCPPQVLAQNPSPLVEGRLIRVQLQESVFATGRITTFPVDSIAFIDALGQRQSYASSIVQRLDVFAGQRTYTNEGILIGFLGGTLIGLSAGATGLDQLFSFYDWPLFLGIFSGFAGALAGGVIGAIPRDVWIRHPRPWWSTPVADVPGTATFRE